MRIAIIDNYDSFVFNLAHLAKEIGAEVDVFRNDKFKLNDLTPYDKIILSPGPGIPQEAGLLLDVIGKYAAQKPILGVCLGHQAIGEYFGGKLTNLSQVYHGVATPIDIISDDYIFEGVAPQTEVGRYHSWVVEKLNFPSELEITAESGEGLVMALKHRKYDIRGIQFHPESVLTKEGHRMLENWIKH